MIAYVEGRVLEATRSGCVLVTAEGVGYEIGLTARLLSLLPEKGAQFGVYTCLVVREDAQELFGFASWDERQMFLILTGINRVGARTALGILSVYPPEELRRLVLNEDVLALTRVPGIGRKTAQQIFIDLSYKLKAEGLTPGAPPTSAAAQVLHDALTGLVNLGYDEQKAHDVLREVLQAEPDLDVGSALRAALKLMTRRA